MKRILHLTAIILLVLSSQSYGQHSIAREWNEILLDGIRNDFARPTVHARNLWHASIAMYDIHAIYNDPAKPFLIGQEVDGFSSTFTGIPQSATPEEDMEIAISYAMYRLMLNRFISAANPGIIINDISMKMSSMGLSTNYSAINYSSGDPRALGNYVADQIIRFGMQDGSWQQLGYQNRFYEPVNDPLILDMPGSQNMIDPNRWQPLTLEIFIDQSGNVRPGATPEFLSPEWGQVTPFALGSDDLTINNRDGFDYFVYHDPGPPPLLTLNASDEESQEYLWGNALVSIWSSHLDASDDKMIDISPRSIGNIPNLPNSVSEYRQFYNLLEGGDSSQGRDINPITGEAYEVQMVPRGDYGRVLAEFWADGPDSETPPGHWFTLINEVMDHPLFERKYRGAGEVQEALEYDIKAYFLLGSAMHDCAIAAWGVKGWYDYIRPVSALRAMVDRGQSSDPTKPNFNVSGMPLFDGYCELVEAGDPLAGVDGEHVGKVKLKAWKGPEYIVEPDTDVAGVDWILGEDWFPYQRPSFVTPPFAGYVSGHSTYSRAAAEVLTYLTGDEYFPGGMGVFECPRNEFLVFEDGPSMNIELQWATYRDASDQCSLSRIYGGIHPPADDIPGRKMGIAIADDVLKKAETYFFNDTDNDGFYDYQDCDDNDPMVNPSMPEVCDGIDNDCIGGIDDGLPQNTYFLDTDNDGYGDLAFPKDTCLATPPIGYVANDFDCNDNDLSINPDISEICDAIDNNCDGRADEGLPKNRYYFDFDNDGFGDLNTFADTCIMVPPVGFVVNFDDCDDEVGNINPTIPETCDGIDNDCSGRADDGLPVTRYYFDFDNDGFGDANIFADTCITVPPIGFVDNDIDCDDMQASINPSMVDIPDNGIDEDCSGYDYYKESKVFPNPFSSNIEVHLDFSENVEARVLDRSGRLLQKRKGMISDNFLQFDLDQYPTGIYYLQIVDENFEELYTERILKI